MMSKFRNFSISSGNFLKIFIVILAKAGIQCFFEFSGFPFSREWRLVPELIEKLQNFFEDIKTLIYVSDAMN